MLDEDDLEDALFELDSYSANPIINLYCDECSLPLADYGYNSFPFGEDDTFADRELCGKCTADFLGEEDFHTDISVVEERISVCKIF